METACLRIKFTPLLKDIDKDDSKCYLEIIPDVTCIQNLDKIEWKAKSDLIEYTVPITYKVILKKRQSVKGISENMEKIYHSCVDLLPSSSLTCDNLASGDVPRIISDTVIVNNLNANLDKDKLLIKKNEIWSSVGLNGACQNMKADHHKPELSIDCIKDNDKQIDSCKLVNAYASTSQLNSVENQYVRNSATKAVSSLQLCKDIKTESVEMVTGISSHSNNVSKENCLRKLSLTPICSIDTTQMPECLYRYDKSYQILSWKSILWRVLEPQICDNGGTQIKELSVKNNNTKVLDQSVEIHNNEIAQRTTYNHIERELPEVRVAKFMKKLESEILPLKIMLYDILKKCSAMGLTKIQKYPLDYISCKNVESTDSEQLVKYCNKSQNRTKCNRVVYTIVFDG